MMKNNKGVSFIELLICIAIMGILATGIVSGIQKLHYANTIKSANRLVSIIKKVRLETMSKEDKYYLYIYHAKDNNYYTITDTLSSLSSPELETKIDSSQKLASESLIYYKSDGDLPSSGDYGNLLEMDHFIRLSFEHGSGRFESDYTDIAIVGKYKSQVIRLIKETGRVVMKE